jgi:hypothetical protein
VNERFHLRRSPLLLPVSQERTQAHLLKVRQPKKEQGRVTIKIRTKLATVIRF